MSDFNQQLYLGNYALFHNKYSRSYRFFENVIKNSNDKNAVLSAQYNLSYVQEKMGMKSESKKTIPFDVGNSDSRSGYVNCNKKTSFYTNNTHFQPILGDKFEEEQPQFFLKSHLENLNDLSSCIEKYDDNSLYFAERAEVFIKMGNLKCSQTDYYNALKRNPKSQYYYNRLLNLQPMLYREFEHDNNYMDSDLDIEKHGFCDLSRARMYWSSGLYDLAEVHLNKAIENGEEGSMTSQALYYLAHGNYSDAMECFNRSDTLSDEMRIILDLPNSLSIHIDVDHTSSSDILVLVSFRDSVIQFMEEKSTEIPINFGIKSMIRNLWCSNGDESMFSFVRDYEESSSSDEEVSDFKNSVYHHYDSTLKEDQLNAGKILLTNLRSIGYATVSSEVNTRLLKVAGIAVINLYQELNNKITYERAISLMCQWFRMVDITIPIFDRQTVPFAEEVIWIQDDDNEFTSKDLLDLVKSKLLDDSNYNTADAITNANNLNDIYEITGSNIYIPTSSDAMLCISADERGSISSALLIPNTLDHWNKYFPPLVSKWYNIVNSLAVCSSPEDGIKKSFEFLYHWMRCSPLTSCNDYIGCSIFHSLIAKHVHLTLVQLPKPTTIMLSSILSDTFEAFYKKMGKYISSNFINTNIEKLPNVSEIFPTFLQKLQFINTSN